MNMIPYAVSHTWPLRPLSKTIYVYLSPTIQLSQDHEFYVYVCVKLTFVLPATVWLKSPELHTRSLSNVILETQYRVVQ